MIREAIDRIVDLSLKSRPAVQEKNGRMWFFNDKEQKYVEEELRYVRSHEVSNMESFITLVREELDRVQAPDGAGATLTLLADGAEFRPQDTGNGRIQHTYTRTLDPFWARLKANVEKPMKHAEFVRFFSGLAPVIGDDYDYLARQFRKVTFDERLTVSSQPMLDSDGKGRNQFSVEFAARSGTGTTTTALPASFDVTTAYTRGSKVAYKVHAEIDLQLRKDGEKSTLLFSYYCPEMEGTEVQAQAVEEAQCRSALADYKKLLIISNY